MTDYKDALIAFVEAFNAEIMTRFCEAEYKSEVEIYTDGYDLFDAATDEVIFIPGFVLSSCDWIDGDPEDEYIKVPEPVTREVYLSVIGQILEKSLWYETYCIKQKRARHEIEDYVVEFCKTLKTEWDIFRDISLEALPLYITDSSPKDDNGNYSANGVVGRYYHNSNLISVFEVTPDHIEDAKRTARHEAIHYFLAAAGLNNADDSGLFWFFATVYDAHPYEPLTGDQQVLFDAFIKKYENENGKDTVNKALVEALKMSA